MLAISFVFFAALEWMLIKNKNSSNTKAFWWILSILLVWNLGANLIPWWPNLDNVVRFMLGWI